MNAFKDILFWILIFELFLGGFIFIHQDLAFRVFDRIELSLRIGFATFLLFISGGTYHSTITVEKNGEIIEEYEIY